jgi:hypothetical protein
MTSLACFGQVHDADAEGHKDELSLAYFRHNDHQGCKPVLIMLALQWLND